MGHRRPLLNQKTRVSPLVSGSGMEFSIKPKDRSDAAIKPLQSVMLPVVDAAVRQGAVGSSPPTNPDGGHPYASVQPPIRATSPTG